MFRIARVFLIAAVSVSSFASAAVAWDDPPEGTSVMMTAGCAGDDVVLSIDFTVVQAPPGQFVGWIVDRTVLGLCVDDAWATEVMAWPEIGQTHLELTVTPDVEFFDAIYRIWAVDSEGNQTFIYWPQRHNFAHAECLPGPSTVGRFVDYAGNTYFEACPESCWPGLSPFDGNYPEGADELVGTDQLMNLHGELFMGMEGVYINATDMEPSSFPCTWVGTAVTSWGGLKAIYR